MNNIFQQISPVGEFPLGREELGHLTFNLGKLGLREAVSAHRDPAGSLMASP